MQLSGQQEIRILHVDDESSITDLTATFLERENDQFSIETATSADEGLQLVSDRPPDCIISDYDMPGTDGLEFLQAVREDYPDLPFILFTGKGSEEVASDAISAGVTDYLRKQSGTEQYELLANRIRNAVDARRDAARVDRQEQLMRLTEFAGDTGGFELDVDTGIFLLTDGACRLIGVPEHTHLSVEEMIDLFHPDDQDEVRQTITRAAETGEQTRGTWRLQTRDGDERLVDVTITPAINGGDVTTLRGAIHDVTRRRERRQELQRLQQAIDGANVPITLADPSQEDEPLVYVNEAFADVTGYPPEEALGRNCRFLQGEDTDPEKVTALRNAIDDEESISLELRNYRKDGTEFWNRLTLTPIYDDSGDLVRYLGTQEDVTERKERERDLRAERQFIEQALDALDDLFYVLDTDGTLRRWNDRLPEVTGYTDGELAEMQATELFPEADRETIADAIETTLADGQTTVEADLQTVDGERLPYEFTGAQLTDDAESVTGLVGVGRDLTGMTNRDVTARERRKHERQKYETLVTALSDPVYVLDDEGRFRYVNDEFMELVGYDRETIIGNPPSLIKAEDAVQQAETQLGRLLSHDGPETVMFEVTIQPRAGDPIVCEDHMGLLPYDGKEFNGSAGVLRDITEHKQYERELEAQNERLEEFASIVSHDLRNPLGVAEGHLELADAGDENEHLAKAADAIERSQALIDDLLTLAREGDKVDEGVPVDLGEVAKKSWQTTETAQATLDVGAPGVIEGDGNRIQQLLENLYRNAVEHGGDDVTVHVGGMADGFYVADTGPGIPEHARGKIFDAGYSTADDGTGFGLRIVEQIGKAHGWEVSVTESTEGGARFDFTGVQKRE